jgi:hypothetical protein
MELMTYTKVAKPSTQSYTNIFKPTTGTYTKIDKPVGSILSITLAGMANGLLIPLTYSTSHNVVGSNWIKILKPT